MKNIRKLVIRQIVFALSAAMLLTGAIAQTKTISKGLHRIEIALEKKTSGKWQAVSPSFIFDQNDLVRFRIRTNFDGYLYVLDLATSGKYELLFPGDQNTEENKVQADNYCYIPGRNTQFRITGPPGHEITYWLISPVKLEGYRKPVQARPALPPASPKSGKPRQNLLPRCNDEIFQARGECIDTTAGPSRVAEDSNLPDNPAFASASRDLVFTPQQNSVVISSAVRLTGPVVL